MTSHHPAPSNPLQRPARATACTLAVVLALASSLLGCASNPPQASAAVTQDDAKLSSPWWSAFNDPLLSQLINQALQANTSIRSAQAALQQARALRDVKAAGLLPSVTATGSAQRAGSDASSAGNSFKAGLDASWELDVFGGKQSALNASEADAQAAQASLADVQVSVAAEVALAYIQLRGLQTQLGIAQANLTSQQDTLQLTDWRAQAGLVTSLEVEQARTATEQTRAQVPTLTANIAKARHSLAVLTGQRPLELDALLQASQPVPQAPSALIQSIPAQTLRQRADVRAAEHRISAALARVNAAEAERYPSFNLGGSLSLSALTLAGLSNGASLAGSLLGSISVPLFDAGAGKNQVLAQEAALEQSRAAYQSTVLAALKDVEDALVALDADRSRLTHLQSAFEAANNAALLAQNRYSAGVIDFQTVLQTQRSLLSSQDSVASTQADISADHVRLVKALGGGWQPGTQP